GACCPLRRGGVSLAAGALGAHRPPAPAGHSGDAVPPTRLRDDESVPFRPAWGLSAHTVDRPGRTVSGLLLHTVPVSEASGVALRLRRHSWRTRHCACCNR